MWTSASWSKSTAAIRLRNMTVKKRHVVLALKEASHAFLDIPHSVHLNHPSFRRHTMTPFFSTATRIECLLLAKTSVLTPDAAPGNDWAPYPPLCETAARSNTHRHSPAARPPGGCPVRPRRAGGRRGPFSVG